MTTIDGENLKNKQQVICDLHSFDCSVSLIRIFGPWWSDCGSDINKNMKIIEKTFGSVRIVRTYNNITYNNNNNIDNNYCMCNFIMFAIGNN